MILYGELTKLEPQADGTLRVHGVASSGARDSAGEVVSPEAMRAALPDYLRFGAIREMHAPRAAGAAISAEVDAAGATRISAHIVDPIAVKKVQAGVYKGLSIGGKVLGRDADDPTVITALRLDEISLVDRPCNPEAVIDLWKAAAPPTNDEVRAEADRLAVAAGRPGRRNDYLAKARAGLLASGPADPASSAQAGDRAEKSYPLVLDNYPASPAKAGAQSAGPTGRSDWIPAFAGNTGEGEAEAPHQNPEGDTDQAPHGAYADPLAALYPLDTAERIRAAWAAIASPANRAAYAEADLAALEARIASAWRAKIDPAGPPSETPADAPAKHADAPAKHADAHDLRKLDALQDALADAEAEVERLTKALADASPEVDRLTRALADQAAEIERLGRQPLPPRTAASRLVKAVSRAEDAGDPDAAFAPGDVAQEALAKALERMPAAERAHLLMKAALARPIPLGG